MLRVHRQLARRAAQEAARCRFVPCAAFSSGPPPSLEALAAQSMATAFRQHGHLQADVDPLGRQSPSAVEGLKPDHFAALFDRSVPDAAAATATTGRALYDKLRAAYCGKAGWEFEHLSSEQEKQWLARTVEGGAREFAAQPSDLRNAYTQMLMADAFEHFMAKKFASFKRYSGEGAESMLPAINTILHACADTGTSDVVIGMPHRGRLALLVALLEYPAHKIFHKVRGNSEFPPHIRGVDDVSSHIAQSVDKHFAASSASAPASSVRVSLLHNPSHLEIINAVTQGKVRAKRDAGKSAMALLLHGDAAFAGQGCVPEALAQSRLPDYATDGAVHIVVNNQVGYTTTFRDARATRYASDVAKSIEAPIVHVNGESIEDVIRACRIAVAYRNAFHKDIVIDLVTFRRHGHNEVDEPRFTQPKLYEAIDRAERFPLAFAQQLQKQGLLTPANMDRALQRMNEHLEAELQRVTPKATGEEPEYSPTTVDAFAGNWTEMKQPSVQDLYTNPTTGLSLDKLVEIGIQSVTLPPSVRPHERLQRTHIAARLKMLTANDKRPDEVRVDWATAEAMAFGSLMLDGHSVRLAGQDCRRGTFSQRHAALTDQETEELVFPLRSLKDARGSLSVVNSNLSELAAMGFEYGYSWENPRNLVIWEAQFGDFFNGAQIVIDQFLACGESKWMRQSGLVLLLPHGYDGAGPDHSSARTERFLQLIDTPALGPSSAEDADNWSKYQHDTNMIVANPTTPANYFHLLRRQQLRDFRKPLVVMGPKTLLRLPEAASPLTELGPDTSFQPVIGDASVTDASRVKSVYLCSGKFYYDLVKAREARTEDPSEFAIVRVEELAPFPFEQIAEQLGTFSHAERIVWVQEEPLNQGAWSYVKPHVDKLLTGKGHGKKGKKKTPTQLEFIGRESLAACAVGLSKRHKQQLEQVLLEAFGPSKDQ
jgi:probable 2-oxoglutarate dehydrogenase E1 component DHKTD1